MTTETERGDDNDDNGGGGGGKERRLMAAREKGDREIGKESVGQGGSHGTRRGDP